MQQLITKLIFKLPRFILRRMAGGEMRIGDRVLNERVALVVAQDRTAPPIETLSVEEARANYELMGETMAGASVPIHSKDDFNIAGPGGDIPMRRYRPRGLSSPAPALLYIHGGGFTIGSIQTHDRLCEVLAHHAHCAVYSVEYRLAPEYPFPAAVQDCEAAWTWLANNAQAEGLDPQRLAVGGDSAGGNLSAVISQTARDKNLVAPKAQLLIYPAVGIQEDTVSMTECADGYVLTRAAMEWFFEHYTGTTTNIDSQLAPIRGDLNNLPPAIVITAGFDPLRDEGADYAKRLRENGVKVIYREHADMTHAFVQFLSLPECRAAVVKMAGELQGLLASGASAE